MPATKTADDILIFFFQLFHVNKADKTMKYQHLLFSLWENRMSSATTPNGVLRAM